MIWQESHVKLTQDELLAEARKRFGDNPMTWAFKCPNCGDVATAKDFPSGSEQLGQACVGRFLGALGCRSNDEWTASGGRGCDWCAFGLFSGPWTVIMPNGKEVGSFPLADVP